MAEYLVCSSYRPHEARLWVQNLCALGCYRSTCIYLNICGGSGWCKRIIRKEEVIKLAEWFIVQTPLCFNMGFNCDLVEILIDTMKRSDYIKLLRSPTSNYSPSDIHPHMIYGDWCVKYSIFIYTQLVYQLQSICRQLCYHPK